MCNHDGSTVVDNTTSDIRLKENVRDSEVWAMDVINRIQMRQFDWKRDGKHQDIGFIADELEELDPGLASGGGYEADGSIVPKAVNDFYLLGYVVKGIQELSDVYVKSGKRVTELEKQISSIEGQLSRALARIAQQDKMIGQLQEGQNVRK